MCYAGWLIPIWPTERVNDTNWLVNDEKITYLLVAQTDDYPGNLSSGFREISKSGEWILYEWKGE